MSIDVASARHKLRRIRYSIASTGLRRSLSDIATHLLAYKPQNDGSFDRRFGTDTAGSVAPENLGISEKAVEQRAILYLPSPERVTRWMLTHIGVEHRDFSFVDLGCGKGRVLLIASEYSFQRVIGVDISAELSVIARQNAAIYQAHSRSRAEITVQTADATRFDFPKSNLFLHLYHPFDPAVTDAVLSNLERSLAPEAHVVVAYLTFASSVESVQAVFARHPWLQCIRYEESVLGQYNWMFYSNKP
jgi:SAM-dependent methyltransferase